MRWALTLGTALTIAPALHAAPPPQAGAPTHWDSAHAPQSTASPEAQEVTTGVDVGEVLAPAPDYAYASLAKPSPFVPPLLSTSVSAPETAIVSALQRYPLAELGVVGIWTNSDHVPRCLVMTHGNEGVVAGIGDPIGDRGGKIFAITPEAVRVRVYSTAPDGGRQFEDTELRLGENVRDSGPSAPSAAPMPSRPAAPRAPEIAPSEQDVIRSAADFVTPAGAGASPVAPVGLSPEIAAKLPAGLTPPVSTAPGP